MLGLGVSLTKLSIFRLLGGAGPAFTPANLFAGSEQGAWFAANDLSTLYQNQLATVAVTAVGETIGFIGDKSKGFTPGSNLVTNGNFDTDIAGWTATGGASLSWEAPGRIRVTPSTINEGATQNVTTVTNGFYRITALPSGQNRIFFGPGAVTLTGNVLGSFVLPASGTTTAIQLTNSEGTPVTYDNVSVQYLQGNHVHQNTGGSRATLRQEAGPGPYYFEDDGDDTMPWTAPSGTYTIAYVIPDGTVTILTDQSLSGATDMMLASQVVEYVAVNRALTGGETAALTAYLQGVANP